jgi:hypothetical protein
MYYDLNIKSDNFYNHGYYGWNWSIYSLNRTFPKLKFNVYVINAYRSTPTPNGHINYNRIEKYFNRVIANYNKKVNSMNWTEKQKLNKKYISAITKKLNQFLEEDFTNAKF